MSRRNDDSPRVYDGIGNWGYLILHGRTEGHTE